MKIFCFILLVSILFSSCQRERCYQCKCIKNGQVYTEERCKKEKNTDRNASANGWEPIIEKEEGYDKCDCSPI